MKIKLTDITFIAVTFESQKIVYKFLDNFQ